MSHTTEYRPETNSATAASRAISQRMGLAVFGVWFTFNASLVTLYLAHLIHPDWVVRLLYDGNTLVLPPVLFAAAALARRKGPGWRSTAALLLPALLLVAIRVYATHIEPFNLQVRELTMTAPGITRPFTLLHISDIQSGAVGNYEADVFERIRSINPDLIVHTGDLLQPYGGRTLESELPRLAALFSTLAPPLGMYAVEGESDTRLAGLPPERLGGLRFVNNKTVNIQAEGLQLRLLGLTLDQSRRRSERTVDAVNSWLSTGPSESVTLVMGHRPEFIAPLLDKPIDLCLAGHTHGGQVCLPFFGALTTASAVPRAWSRGFFSIGRTHINVSAGIGASHNKGLPSIRINCPPEMTLIHFEPAG